MYAINYDLNIWSDHPGELTLTAYELEQIPFEDGLQTNTSRYHSIKFHVIRDRAEVEFLLNDLWVNHHPLTGYDTWVGLAQLISEKTPPRIQEFLDRLPNYDAPELAKQ
jgi:hypothetical protein